MQYPVFKCLLVSLSAASLIGCGGGSSSSESTPEPVVNVAPKIEIMTPSLVNERDSFEYTPIVSDSDGTIVSYSWKQTSGTEVLNLVSDKEVLSFVAPDLAATEKLGFSLTVNDNDNAATTASFEVEVTVYDQINSSTISNVSLIECAKNDPNLDLGVKAISCDGIAFDSLADFDKFEYLESLEITNANLQDISGLTLLTELTELNLAYNNISDVSDVLSLNQLTSLNLNENPIDDLSMLVDNINIVGSLRVLELNAIEGHSHHSIQIESLLGLKDSIEKLSLNHVGINGEQYLGKLTNLKELHLKSGYSSINALSFLLSLPDLVVLDIGGNVNIRDLSALIKSSKLEELNLSGIDAYDITPLSELLLLEKLNLNSSFRYHKPDLDALKGLTSLTSLTLSNNIGFNNINVIGSFSELSELNLSGVNVASVSFLRKLSSLKILDLSNNSRLSDISHLSELKLLEQLDISGNYNLDDISSLNHLINLKKLNISNLFSQGVDLSSLKSLEGMEELIAKGNNYRGLDNLSLLKGLVKLDLSDSNLSSLFDFNLLENLEYLDISRNSLVSISSLENATGLTYLDASYNSELSQIDDVANLLSLKTFYLKSNRALTEISNLEGLVSLTEIDLAGSENILSIDILMKLKNLESINLQGLKRILCSDITLLEEAIPNSRVERGYSCVNIPVDENVILDENLRECLERKEYFDILKVNSLNCGYSNIKSLEGIEQLYNLRSLYLYSNELTDLKPILPLSKLMYLNLSDNEKASCDDVILIEDKLSLSSFDKPSQCN